MRASRIILAAVLCAAGCTAPRERAPEFDESAWRADLERWKSERAQRLASPDGWLTLVGLDWLEPGENRVGSGADCTVHLPDGRAPERIGSLWLAEGKVRFEPVPGLDLTIGDQPAQAGELATDASGSPDVVKVGDVSFHVIVRGQRFGVRVKDSQAPARTTFAGLQYYPADTAYRVIGRLRRHASPVEIAIPNVLGTEEPMRSPGVVEFDLNGERIDLVPVQADPEKPQLWFILRDGTSGHGTYPAGRFLYADLLPDDRVVLDFNRAQNPPCAFTPYATCPLPPRANWLNAAIAAGEKDFGHHGDA